MKPSVIAIAVLLGATSGGAQAAASLQDIMRDMGAELGRLAQALSADDLDRAAEAARAIAEHPRPPLAERMRILGRLGNDAAAFRAGDHEVHEAALAVRAAADAADRDALRSGFHRLMNGCLDCHTRFRARLRTAEE